MVYTIGHFQTSSVNVHIFIVQLNLSKRFNHLLLFLKGLCSDYTSNIQNVGNKTLMGLTVLCPQYMFHALSTEHWFQIITPYPDPPPVESTYYCFQAVQTPIRGFKSPLIESGQFENY